MSVWQRHVKRLVVAFNELTEALRRGLIRLLLENGNSYEEIYKVVSSYVIAFGECCKLLKRDLIAVALKL